MEDVLFADHHLGHAGGIAQIQEGHTTVVAAAGHPAGEGNGLSDVLGPEGAEVVCAQHNSPSGRTNCSAVRLLLFTCAAAAYGYG